MAAKKKDKQAESSTAKAANAGVTEADKAAVKEKEAKPPKELVTVKAGALSVEVGPRVIQGLSKSYEDESKAKQLLQAVEGKRFDLLADLTSAIVKAAKADTSINLAATFDGDAKAMNVLNDQLGLALGFREVQTVVSEGGKETKKIAYAKTVSKFFPMPKDDKKAAETIKKATLRSNFLHMLKKTAQAAAAIVDKDITVKKDTATGTLMLTGPAIQKQFGAESVLLNDKLTVGEGDNAKKLNAKPSFTAIAKMGAEAHGKVLQTRTDSRVQSGAVDPDTALQSICNTLVQAIGKLKDKPIAKTVESLNSVKSAIDKVLKA